MNSIEKVIKLTEDAILASGKKFREIDPESIKGFLRNQSDLSKDQINVVMERLSEIYSGKKPQKVVHVDTPVHTQDSYVPKVKEARKSVFGEIKKIA
jgi:hypothetical protein